MMTDEQIVEQLKQKEANLMLQLDKVRLALSAFSIDSKSLQTDFFGQPIGNHVDSKEKYDQFLSLDQKVIFALRSINHGYIDDMVEFLIERGDSLEKDKLFKSLTGSASRLLGKEILKADKRGRKFKYSLNPDTEKERAEILPLYE